MRHYNMVTKLKIDDSLYEEYMVLKIPYWNLNYLILSTYHQFVCPNDA